MMYQFYQAQQDVLDPWRFVARNIASLSDLAAPLNPFGFGMHPLRAGLELFGHGGTTHQHPPFGIETVSVGNRLVPVVEEVQYSTPFGNLLHFRKDIEAGQPRVLIVAPLSGHFATLLRNTAATMLRDHDVFITDWNNARDIPLAAGRFDFDAYVAHVMEFLNELGPDCHVVAVCQPAVAVLAAVSLMSEMDHPATPRSMTLMAGPIDVRRNPTRVNLLARKHDIGWFEANMIARVPSRYKGAGRRVYPGFMQLTSFMSMNLDRHFGANLRQFRALMMDDSEASFSHRKFYDEYLAVMDLAAEFYLETVKRVFQDHELPRGELSWRGTKVRPQAIRRTALLTVEAERDDICAKGQTSVALDLCSGLPDDMKRHYLQEGVGHYGVFAGRRWESGIYPAIRDMIGAASPST